MDRLMCVLKVHINQTLSLYIYIYQSSLAILALFLYGQLCMDRQHQLDQVLNILFLAEIEKLDRSSVKEFHQFYVLVSSEKKVLCLVYNFYTEQYYWLRTLKKKKNTFIQLYSVPKTNKPKITTLVIIFYIFVLVFVFGTTTR